MANYESKCRTNYFAITDKEKFANIIKNLSGDGEIAFYEHDTDKGKYMFYCDGVLNGYKITPDENDGSNKAVAKMIAELQQILPDGEAIILIESGSEKVNLISCVATIITNTDVQYINLSEAAIAKASEMLGNPDYTTEMEY